MEDTKKQISYDNIVSLMDKRYSLYYVDYQESLDESLEKVQDAIHGDFEGLDEITMDWDIWETEKEYLKQLRDKVASHYNIDEDEAQELIDEHEDDLRSVMGDRDDSTPLADLMRNTGDQVFFYDTGVEIGDMYAPLKERVRDVKKAIKILQKNKEFDDTIEELVENATYGGRLVIYFRDGLKEWVELDDDINTIKFSNIVTVAVINNGNGSGFDVEMKHEFTIPFNRKNVFIDKTVKYSYVYDVCGLDPQWCKKTGVSLLKRKTKKVAAISAINDHIEWEKKLDEVFKKGGCTPGDMKYSRHRDVEYINNYPCGSRCPHCHTFWID